MQKLIECIPNFSEGRSQEVVEAIAGAISSVKGITLLDFSLDADHNRSVVTFIGSPNSVEQAAFLAMQKAKELINMEEHSGEHPRIGSTDVVPFVPIAGVTMKDCVDLANRVAKRVGDELNIPIYLYEKAATKKERENLATVRKGQYEGLKVDILNDPDREPDYGPKELGSAGATAIGARDPLVAYNVYLDTDDVKVAEKIGKAVRHSSGGLRYVKGLGMLVDGKAQVSMNLTNYKKTPVHRVVEMIRREAAQYGAQITHSELIGLIPEKALIDAAVWYLQLNDFSSEQILEEKIKATESVEDSNSDFLENLAAGTATPGGGSAAAFNGAMAAALVAMVAKLTVKNKKYESVKAEMEKVAVEADKLRGELTLAVKKDSDAFEEVMAAYKLPKVTDEDKQIRKEKIQVAFLNASHVPLEVVKLCVKVMSLVVTVAEKGNSNAITDAASGFANAVSGVTGAAMNVRINLGSLKDEGQVNSIKEELHSYESEVKELRKKIIKAVEENGKIPFSKI